MMAENVEFTAEKTAIATKIAGMWLQVVVVFAGSVVFWTLTTIIVLIQTCCRVCLILPHQFYVGLYLYA